MPLMSIWVGAALSMALGQEPRPLKAAAGVPLALAQERARRISGLHYELSLSIPAAASAPIDARAVIRFTLTDANAPLVLDFASPDRQVAVSSGGTAIQFGLEADHLIVPASALRAGTNELTLAFRAGDAPLNRNPDFLYTIFVPARAHLAFPCFDQPDLKAVWALSLDVPRDWEVLANGAEIDQRQQGDRVHVRFAETQPLPTYLFAFATGRFSIEKAERAGRRFRMFHRETDKEKVTRNRDALFDLHAAALEWLERYTGVPYPFGKFDFLLVPSFQFGGMEHAGAIFYNASGLLLDPSATQNQKLGRASVIAHETSHMWFGDLVTMRWFDDVWMKEVFANFTAAKIVNPSFPGINHPLRFLLSYYPAAYDVDRTEGTNAIRQRLDNLNEAGSLYGAIIYQKAPIVMRQLEMILGEDGLRDGLREYLRAHQFGNAGWADLIKVLDARTPEDLERWSRAWVEEPGRPNIHTEIRRSGSRTSSIAFRQSDSAPQGRRIWPQRLRVVLGYGAEERSVTVMLNAPRVEISAPVDGRDPDYVLPTGGGIGYGGFELDPASRAYLVENLTAVRDPLTRGAALVTLWEEMLDGRIAPARMLETLLAALPVERDELNVQRMLGYSQQAYWKFTPEPERHAIAPRLEQVLRGGMDAATSQSLKSAWFSALRDVAESPSVLRWLETVWRKKEEVPGLTLAEPDYITLALELAVREVPAWEEILDEEDTRIQNADRKARFEFVRPALSPDMAARDAFFASLRNVANRRHEPWVLEALSYLHHPLRAASAERYIPPSLSMLRDIQRTGDIFFPKRWTDATLGGHSSPSAARMVRTFLAGLPPDYPDRLRRIVLSSADDLFRATRMAR